MTVHLELQDSAWDTKQRQARIMSVRTVAFATFFLTVLFFGGIVPG